MGNITKKQLEMQLIRNGMNKKEASLLAKKHQNYLNRVYKDASLKLKANIAMTLGR